MKKRLFFFVFHVLLLSCKGQIQPNIILVLADDLGYNDLSSYGSIKVNTPNIDALVQQGMKFTNYRTAASICSPSRAALLTGTYPQRSGLYMGIHSEREPHWFLGLSPEEITIAEQVKKLNYSTFMVGKWHLGTEEKFSYLNQGFDDYYGMPCNYNQSKKFFDGKQLVYEETPLGELTGLYTKRITDLIKKNSTKPFFLFYSHNYPHTPYVAGDKFKGSSADGARGDVIQEFDWSVGEIVNTLKDEGILSNTIIIFTSDNGPMKEEYSKPYRGRKYTSLEGGHKVPFIISWPSKLLGSKQIDAPVFAMDLFPTISDIIKAEMPIDREYDGESLLPFFDNEAKFSKKNVSFYYYNCENLQAVSFENWKLHLPRTSEQLPWWDQNKKEFTNISKPVLYDLSKDITESENIADHHPEVVKKLLNIASEAREELGEYNQRGFGQRATGSLFPNVPVISHPRDWERLPDSIKNNIFSK